MATGDHQPSLHPCLDRLIRSSANLFSRFQSATSPAAPGSPTPQSSIWGPVVSVPVLFADSPMPLPWPRLLPPLSSSSFSSASSSPQRSNINVSSSSLSPPTGFSSSSSSSATGAMRIDGLGAFKGRGPAFVGQVFSMCDPSGSGLMAVTTHIQIPFINSKTPKWIKDLVNIIAKNEKDGGPVFRFFMDLSDAVSYVRKLNIPTGMVGACRLDVAYEHFKEKPHMFQFVPNRKQVKAANKLLKTLPLNSRNRKMSGVPVFTAQNLNIAIATSDGIKWYTPYFFDKDLLDNILEASIDQHFQTLIQNRHIQRRRDAIDDSVAAEVVEDHGDSLFEPPEVQEVMDEFGHPGIPLSVLSKVAEIQVLDVVDKVFLGNRWLRKATGIQPKLPYMVDSFEERSAAAFHKIRESAGSTATLEVGSGDSRDEWQLSRFSDGIGGSEELHIKEKGFHFPFGSWHPSSWANFFCKQKGDHNIKESNARSTSEDVSHVSQVSSNPLLPRITMVGISTSEAAPMSKTNFRKTMEDLTRELEHPRQQINQLNEDMDPLFVANVGDYSSLTKTRSA